MSDSFDVDADVPDTVVREMVTQLRPAWAVESISRHAHGTDFVATVEVETPDGPLTAVLKATTAGLVGELARAEPRLLQLVGRRTTIPVPTLFGFCDAHPEFPAPFYLLSHEDGSNLEGDSDRLPATARERVVRVAGQHLAELHALGPLDAVGTVGVVDGELAVLDTEAHPQHRDSRDYALESGLEAVGTLSDGGFFPQFADQPDRFADLVPTLETYLQETAPEFPEPGAPTYCHRDYRYGNLLLDPDTGETRAVLDWAGTRSLEPAYNLAIAESLLLDEPGEQWTERLRRAFRDAYAAQRDGWTFDEATRERMTFYRVVERLHAMACLPLWFRDGTAEKRDDVERKHRAFLARYVDT